MATILPPPSKKQRREAQQPRNLDLIPEGLPNVLVKFQAFDTGASVGGSLRVPAGITEKQLEELLNQVSGTGDEPVPYSFSCEVQGKDGKGQTVDIIDNLYHSLLGPGLKGTEDFITLVYTPKAVFKVRPVTRSSSAIAGHGATILCSAFAPHTSSRMVTGAGDNTARIWDCDTQTPLCTLKGHSNWVLCVAWSADGEVIATGSMDATIRLWDSEKGQSLGDALRGHTKWITSLSWEPIHLVKPGEKPRLASASKDGTIKIWDTTRRVCIYTLSGHTSSVSCIKWGGRNVLYSASHDRTVRCWDMAAGGKCINILKSHAHWVNHLSLSTDYALRMGPFDHTGTKPASPEDAQARALRNYEKVAKKNGTMEELMVTGSDDFTMYLWNPLKGSKPILRMTGHQKLVNHVAFSPDGRYIVSASFDNSIKLWDGRDGKFIATFRGHVASVYQVAWSSDCRLLVSCSKDTTLKVWDVKTRKLTVDLPGHNDEVYTVDWSVDGKRVCSGGKDKMVRLWTH
ncbi:AER263Cp [Eremothecium gossypii ATCC 10895]|uniref:Ribosome assembly protein 4 n=1 Tax=Eremothecium gossypii (strain ATCC 10895 / CBS 109.51 / FGSC 9923 / NRRL Y-1056) TaxID=284811 RepID=Q756W4_EREGS|nr:AER263Cp [Eremothecium gossypii ATCC 10895]AAS52944.1 AER263Cp [Eremothecium gossypii ATCC 10895]AEY97251.1 FAER263Cp [Eremothecium gossypii FDAG1]